MKKYFVTFSLVLSMSISFPLYAQGHTSYPDTQLLAYNEGGWEITDYLYAYNSKGHFITHLQLASKYINGEWHYKVRDYNGSGWSSVYRGSYTCGDVHCNACCTIEGVTLYFKL